MTTQHLHLSRVLPSSPPSIVNDNCVSGKVRDRAVDGYFSSKIFSGGVTKVVAEN